MKIMIPLTLRRILIACFASALIALLFQPSLADTPTYVLNGETQKWNGSSMIMPATTDAGNTVSVSNGEITGSYAYIYGANGSGEASHNVVSLDNLTGVRTVYGGRSSGNHSSHNTIVIADSGILAGSMIYGGYTNASGGDSSNNTITLKGNMTIGDNVKIYGGFSLSGTAAHNTLVLDNLSSNSVASIDYFDTIRISVDSWSNGSSVLSLGRDCSTPDAITLSFNPVTWNVAAKGEQMTLISGFSDSEISTVSWVVEGNAAQFFTLKSIFNADTNAWDVVAVSTMAGSNSGDSIPEPTTATLSLLALACLAARRRRK